MGSGGSDFQSAPAGHAGELAPQPDDLGAGLGDVAADVGPEFHDRLVHLGLDLFVEYDFSFAEDLLNVGTQFTRFRIDDLELFLDPEGVNVFRCAHALATSAKSGSRASVENASGRRINRR